MELADKPRPYFMTNPEWYYHDDEEYIYKLTEKAPPEAIKSYEETYAYRLKRTNEPPEIV